MNNKLFLGSHSQSRQRLLKEAQIPFQVVGHTLDETKCDWSSVAFRELVAQIALNKMEHVIMPEGQEGGQISFFLTADTLCMTKNGDIQGKPKDRADAIEKLKAARGGAQVATAFCLDKRVFKFGQWEVTKRVQQVVGAEYSFEVSDEWIDLYLEKSLGLSGSGAIAIEGFGDQFLKMVHGSYSAIIGLPMFELRESLKEIGFCRSL